MKKDIRSMNDAELVENVSRLIKTERGAVLDQLHYFCEILRRKLYARKGYSGLFPYLVKEEGLSKGCAYQRSTIARAALRVPALLSDLEAGKLTLETAVLVAKEILDRNNPGILEKAAGQTKEQMELLLLGSVSRSNTRDTFRTLGVLPEKEPDETAVRPKVISQEPELNPAAPSEKAVTPVSQPSVEKKGVDPSKVVVKVSFATNKSVVEKLNRAKDLLARKRPEGRLSDVLEEVLDAFLKSHDPALAKKRAQAKTEFRPEPPKAVKTTSSRYIPARVKRAVYARDGGQCTYEGQAGHRCAATRFLEWDHVRPYALGGRSYDPENIRLLCSMHNRLRGEDTFGIRTS